MILQSVRSLWLRFFLQTISKVRYKILRLEVEKHHFILIIGPHVNKDMFQHVSRPNIHQNGPEILGVNILYHKKPFSKPLQFTCAHNFQKSKHTLQWSLRPLMGGQKVKKLAEIFMVDVRILYVLVVKISDFFDFFDFFWNLCAISKVALVVFVWLIFKLDFDLDDDLIWI
jgi:hypothetical protein